MHRSPHSTARFFLTLATLLLLAPAYSDNQDPPAGNYLIGSGIADVTGPAYGIQMWGFGHGGQVTEGIHLRLKSRAFVISDPAKKSRVAFVSVDVGSIEHNITLEVLERLERQYGSLYSINNVILSATHTHSGPSGYWHNRRDSFLTGPFYQEHFETIVSGIVESITMAHSTLQPGSILLNRGDVLGAGANRSIIAYQQNPAAERALYASNIDQEMTLLKLSTAGGDIGMVNWHAVHPTSMTFNNRLISGDHKGYAAHEFERVQNARHKDKMPFVGAFAQANPGDVTSNLNLDNSGPGADDFESTKIIAGRQLAVARNLFDSAVERVEGKIDSRQIYVDLSNFEVSGRYSDGETHRTCPSAYGYPFFGGSSEDGGGNFLFEEGMTEQNLFIDLLAKLVFRVPSFTDEVKDCQSPKAILLQTGSGEPPLQTQIRSISLVRIGQLVIAAVPAEVTTMAGRRLRNTVMAELGDWAKTIVIAGYSNGYAGYVTTAEEYRQQQYEGGHTLHGPWTLAAYQEIGRTLALELETATDPQRTVSFDDWRGKTTSTSLRSGKPDVMPQGVRFGAVVEPASSTLVRGEAKTISFWSSNPTFNQGFDEHYMVVEEQNGDQWSKVVTEEDWSTKIRWRSKSKSYLADLTWTPDSNTVAGVYRIRHFGQYTNADGAQVDFEGASDALTLP